MSPTWDAVLTIAEFVLILPAVLFAIAGAPMFFMLTDGSSTESSRRVVPVAIAAVVLPALAVVAVYATTAVLAWRATGATWFYPLVGLAVGAALWFGIVGAAGVLVKRLNLPPLPPRRRGQRS